MKKLAFGYASAGSFEMPELKTVGLEKEKNIAFATPGTVYEGSGGSFTKADKIREALASELEIAGARS